MPKKVSGTEKADFGGYKYPKKISKFFHFFSFSVKHHARTHPYIVVGFFSGEGVFRQCLSKTSEGRYIIGRS
jgi:hypothetical protein